MTTSTEATATWGRHLSVDTRILKRSLRNILPAQVYNALRRMVHARRLSRVPVMAVDVAPLPRAAEISFPEMLQGDGIADGWEKAKISINEIFEDVPGSHAIDHEGRRIIYHLTRRFQPRSFLEIGTNCGAATLHAAMAMKAYRNGDRSLRLVTVDLFDVNNTAAAEAKRYRISTPPRKMLARLDCADLVEFVIARSTDYLNGRAAEFDFIFVDHGASADIVYQDIPLMLTALRPGGRLVMNSYFPDGKPLRVDGIASPGAWLAVRRLRHEGARLVAVPLGLLPWPTGPGGSNLTSLALLARE